MAIDPSQFHTLNVSDTCATWNVLSSQLLYQAALSVRCVFSCTAYVVYECLFKPRKNRTTGDEELQNRLRVARGNGQFQSYHLEIDDLLEVEILEQRKNLGKGELSAIAFAKRTQQAFHTDDMSARKLASQVLGAQRVQTTPHLFGWLCFKGWLSDTDKETIIKDHTDLQRPLGPHFEEMYQRALSYRLMVQSEKDEEAESSHKREVTTRL
jgi:hypothetical protein